MSRIEGALQFIRGVDGVDAALIGVNDEPQLRECVAAFRGNAAARVDYSSIASSRESLLNPATWPARQATTEGAACRS